MKKNGIISRSIVIVFLSIIVYYVYPENKLPDSQKSDRIVINKASHELILYKNEVLLAAYKVSLGRNGLAAKNKGRGQLNTGRTFSR